MVLTLKNKEKAFTAALTEKEEAWHLLERKTLFDSGKTLLKFTSVCSSHSQSKSKCFCCLSG